MKSTQSKDESDITKYFKDSLVFPSKNTIAGKENEMSANKKLNHNSKHRVFSLDCTSLFNNDVENAKGKKNTDHCLSWQSLQGSAFKEQTNLKFGNSTVGVSVDAEEKSQKIATIDSSVEISSRVATSDRCCLSFWGLPTAILRKYKARGVERMLMWQVECLANTELLEKNRNLVYSAPTSAGKTLVAEILVIKTIAERRRKVIFILPFVSVVREKMYYFQDLLNESGFRVEGFMGGCAPAGGFAATDLAVATIEKANSLLNQLMENGNLGELGAVVIDELHLLGDPHRGYLVELLLTKLKYMNLKDEGMHVQLIGMSATLPNLATLAKWLDAELYKTDFRPVPLKELCKIGATIYNNEMKFVRDLVPSLATDADNIIQLCIETISDGHSVLIFCPTKSWCEKLARQIAARFCSLGREDTPIGRVLRQQLKTEAILETLEQLKRSLAGLDDVLKSTVSFGAAFHHAGLTMDERDVIEAAFRSGALRVLAATSTLSSGVNLPARRVIIRSLMFHGKPLDTLTYRQMIGRAGRMGKDTAGESILMCKTNETRPASALLTAQLPPIESCLEGSESMVRALLEAVASEVAYTSRDIDLYMRCTLASVTSEELVDSWTRGALEFLTRNELLMLQTSVTGERRWIATPLGKACLAASVPPSDGLLMFEELHKARKCFVLDTELHVVYLVTPLNSSTQIGQIDWLVFLDIWKGISDSERRVGQMVGIDENFLMSAIRGVARSGKVLNAHKRFYTAMALHDLVREVPLVEVCRKYGCCRGIVQSLQQSAATFAGMVTQFCKKLGWDCMELLIGQFQARLQFGVSRELLDLLRLPMLNGLRARSLYREGITCVAELAVANVLDVERSLHKALPFESGKEHSGEHELEAARRNKMRSVFVTGRDGLTIQEAAVILVREARTLVQNELGLENLQWEQREEQSTKISKSSTCSGTNESSIEHRTGRDTVKSIRAQNSCQIHAQNYVRSLQSREDENVARADCCTGLKETTDLDTTELVSEMISSKRMSLSNGIVDPDNVASRDKVFKLASTLSPLVCKTNAPTIYAEVSGGIKKTSVPGENVTASKCLEDFCDKDVFANCGHAVNPKNIWALRTDDNISLDDSVEFAEIVNALDSEMEVIGAGTCKEMCRKAAVEFANPSDAIDSREEPIGITSAIEQTFSDYPPNTRNAIDRMNLQPESDKSPEISDFSTKLSMTLFEENPAMRKRAITSPITLIRESFGKASEDSRSPSLFSDSLNQETPECAMLERNIIDSLGVSMFGDTNFSEFVDSQERTPETRGTLEATASKARSSRNQRRSLLKHSGLRRPSRISDSKNGRESLIWGDDSWNATNNLVDPFDVSNKMITLGNAKDSQGLFASPPSNGVPQKSRACRKPRIDHEDRLVPKSRMTQLQRLTHKRTSSESNVEVSPIASLLKISNTRKLSVGSNKSDSDDVIVSSQIARSISSHVKNRTRLKLESLRSLRIERTISTRAQESRDNNRSILCESCSVDSILSSSDEESLAKRRRTILPVNKVPPKRMLAVTNQTQVRKPMTLRPRETEVVNIAANWAKFNQFKRDLANNADIALALACETFLNGATSIGTKIIGVTSVDGRKKTRKVENCVYGNKKICGVAVSWDGAVAYYMSFDNTKESKVPVKERLALLKDTLTSCDRTIRCFSFKDAYKMLYNCCRIASFCKFLDPKTAEWLLNPESSDRSFNAIIAEHLSEAKFMVDRIGTRDAVSSDFRAATEAALTWHLTNVLMMKLKACSSQLLTTFRDIEMETAALLARMELTGLGVNLKSLRELSDVIQQEMCQLENMAYTLAGRKFNFSSSKGVAQVLELNKGKKVSTSKAVLEHCENPIARLVISWRKLSTTQSKVVFPLLRLAECNSRIHGNCVTDTVTGRISMHEPNLQNVPRDFFFHDDSFLMSVRTAFVPMQSNLMLSADYCQLELRVLAHFSEEPNLCRILRKEGDVFKNIAAQWYNMPEDQINEDMRHRTKQLCYGMIYGMGAKSLAENLGVTEPEAKEFLETFMGAYPGIRQWLTRVVEEAHTCGFVTTLMARQRYLPALKSEISSERSQAERQAINTKVQGSAADIVKRAMVKIDERMRREFPDTPLVLTDIPIKRKLRNSSPEKLPRGGFLVLQIHDELLYEVNASDLQQVGRVIKESMEQSCELRVPLPVKVKVGPTWGDLTEIKLQSL